MRLYPTVTFLYIAVFRNFLVSVIDSKSDILPSLFAVSFGKNSVATVTQYTVIAIFASKANRKGIENGDIHLEIGDCCNLLYQDATFDVVITMNTIYFWKDTIKGLTEIYRVLKSGGKFYNAVLTKESLDKVFYT